MLNITVIGAAGKMGSRVITLAKDNEDINLVGAVENRAHKGIGQDIGDIIAIGSTGIKLISDIRAVADKTDVCIDFSHPESTLQCIKALSDKPVPLIIGTTGLGKDGTEKIKSYAQKVPCVFAPNMSVGVNLLLRVLTDIAKVTGDDYDVEIIEAHHRLKKDAPSGTALKMAQVIASALNRNLDDSAVYSRKGLIGKRTQKEIGIQTIRAGDIVGEHTVIFGGLGERIEITHRASSRDTFARGALKAALWVSQQAPGLYDMQDVLGLK